MKMSEKFQKQISKIETIAQTTEAEINQLVSGIEMATQDRTEARRRYDQAVDVGDRVAANNSLDAISTAHKTAEGLKLELINFDTGKIEKLDGKIRALLDDRRAELKSAETAILEAEKIRDGLKSEVTHTQNLFNLKQSVNFKISQAKEKFSPKPHVPRPFIDHEKIARDVHNAEIDRQNAEIRRKNEEVEKAIRRR